MYINIRSSFSPSFSPSRASFSPSFSPSFGNSRASFSLSRASFSPSRASFSPSKASFSPSTARAFLLIRNLLFFYIKFVIKLKRNFLFFYIKFVICAIIFLWYFFKITIWQKIYESFLFHDKKCSGSDSRSVTLGSEMCTCFSSVPSQSESNNGSSVNNASYTQQDSFLSVYHCIYNNILLYLYNFFFNCLLSQDVCCSIELKVVQTV